MTKQDEFERFEQQEESRWFLRSIVFLFIVLICMLLVNIDNVALLILTIIIILGGIRLRKIRNENKLISMRNLIGLYLKHIKLNRKHLIGVSIILMFAFSIFAHLSINQYNYQHQEIIESSTKYPMHKIQTSTTDTSVSVISEQYEKVAQEKGLIVDNFISIPKIAFTLNLADYTNITEVLKFSSVPISYDLFSYMRSFNSFDNKITSENTILTIVPEVFQNFRIQNNSITINFEDVSTTLNIDYIWQPSLEDYEIIKSDQMVRDIIKNNLIVTSDNLDNLTEFVSNTDITQYLIYPYLDFNSAIKYSSQELSKILRGIRLEVKESFELTDFYVEETGTLERALQGSTGTYTDYTVFSIFYYLPLLLIAVFAIHFASSMAFEKKSKFYKKLINRGLGRNEIKFLNLLELFPILVVGYLLSILASFMWLTYDIINGNLTGVNSFDNLFIPLEIIWKLPIMMFSILFLVSINRINKISNGEEKFSEKEQSSIINRANIDVILLIISIIFSIILRLDLARLYPSTPQVRLIYDYISIINYVLILSAAFFTTRITFNLLFTLSKKLEQFDFGFTKLSLVNLNQFRSSTQNLLVLLVFLTLLASSSFFIPHSINEWEQSRSEYISGSDLRFEGISQVMIENDFLQTNMSLFDGVITEKIKEISPFYRITTNLFIEQQGSKNLVSDLTIIALDVENAQNVLNYQQGTSNNDFENLINILKQNKTIVGQTILDSLPSESRNQINVGHTGLQLNYTVGDSVLQFPGVFPTIERQEIAYYDYTFIPEQFFVIGELNYILDNIPINERNSNGLRIVPGGFIDVDDRYNTPSAISDIINQFEGVILDIDTPEEISEVIQNYPRQIILTNLSSSILFITTIFLIFSLAYFMYLKLSDEAAEIGLLRTIGYSKLQIQFLQILRYLSILVISIISGITFGYLVASNYLLELSHERNYNGYPSLSVETNLSAFLVFLVLVSLGFLVLIKIIIGKYHSISIENIFKGES